MPAQYTHNLDSATLLVLREQRLQHILLVGWEYLLCTQPHLRPNIKYGLIAQKFICVQTLHIV